MANQVFNVALGRVAEFYNRVDQNDPANAVLVLAVWNVTGVEATVEAAVKDADTVSAVEALADIAEVTNPGYSRIVLDDTDLVAFAPDDANDRVDLDFPDQTFSSVSAGDAWTDLSVNFDSDSTGGADSAIIPCTWHDFVVTPNGGDITAQVDAAGFYRAS